MIRQIDVRQIYKDRPVVALFPDKPEQLSGLHILLDVIFYNVLGAFGYNFYHCDKANGHCTYDSPCNCEYVFSFFILVRKMIRTILLSLIYLIWTRFST